ncbi:MAG: tetratricopeptide repeat protein [Cyanobacteria bacterium]|nr:tetratricopeptide repeat protein [Cyanobacteriota bacterium]MDW8200691.1 tetratricopeptide repeat protein [Cyanobacteriota bacterium SKYGB_h_bin112]
MPSQFTEILYQWTELESSDIRDGWCALGKNHRPWQLFLHPALAGWLIWGLVSCGVGSPVAIAQPLPAVNQQGFPEPQTTASAMRLLERGLSKAVIRDWQGAIDDYTLAIRQDPTLVAAYVNRGIAYRQLGQSQQAIADYTQAIRLNPNNAEVFNNRAIAHLSMGQRQMALSDFTTAINLNPNYAKAFYGRGTVRRQLNDHQGAMADFNQAIQLDPTYADAYYGRGLYRQQLGERRGALADFRRAAELYQATGNTQRYQETLKRVEAVQRSLQTQTR